MTEQHLALALALQRCTFFGDTQELLALNNTRIYITGCSGWLGKCLLEALWKSLGEREFNNRVRPFTSAGNTVTLRDGISVQTFRFDTLPEFRENRSVLFNFAYLTREKAFKMELNEYISANRKISETVFSSLSRLNCVRLFLPSSGAVYRAVVQEHSFSAANAYGKLKLEDEQRALTWSKQDKQRRAIICRVFNLSGPYINKYSDYVLSSIIASILRQEPIRIRTPVVTLRSYVSTDELLSLVVALMLAPDQDSVIFDTAGEETLEIEELVELVSACIPTNSPVERPSKSELKVDRYIGERLLYANLLQRYKIAPIPMKTQILQTTAYIKQFPELS